MDPRGGNSNKASLHCHARSVHYLEMLGVELRIPDSVDHMGVGPGMAPLCCHARGEPGVREQQARQEPVEDSEASFVSVNPLNVIVRASLWPRDVRQQTYGRKPMGSTQESSAENTQQIRTPLRWKEGKLHHLNRIREVGLRHVTTTSWITAPPHPPRSMLRSDARMGLATRSGALLFPFGRGVGRPASRTRSRRGWRCQH